MRNTKELPKKIDVSQHLQEMSQKSANELLLHDTEQMYKTMQEWPVDQVGKKEALKRVMLMSAIGLDVEHSGEKLQDSMKKCSMATYFSHGQRVKIDVEGVSKNDLMNYIAGGSKQISTKDVWPGSKVDDGGKVMHNRAAGTHGIEIKKGRSKELKGKSYGAFSAILKSAMWLLRPISLVFRPVVKYFAPKFYEKARMALSTQHWGINMAIKNPVKQGKIKADGTNGHMYLNFTEGKNTSDQKTTAFIVGIEPSAPNQKSASGAAHSKTGGKSNLSPVGSFGWYDKASPNNKNFSNHIKNMVAVQNQSDRENQGNGVAEKFAKTWLKIQKGQKVSKKDLHAFAGNIGIEIREMNGKDMFLYPTAKKLEKAGFGIPKPYGGLNAKISAEEFVKVMGEKIPDEIVYYKPAKSFEDLMKQKDIFKNIEEKPLLKNNPHLSLKCCMQVSLAYELAKGDGTTEIAASLRQLESQKSVDYRNILEFAEKIGLANVDENKTYIDNWNSLCENSRDPGRFVEKVQKERSVNLSSSPSIGG